MISTPMDALNEMKGNPVVVRTKQNEEIKGKLLSFDLNQNMSLDTKDGIRFVQGQNVSDISPYQD